MERKKEQRISALLEAFIRANNLEKGLAEHRMKKAWHTMLGNSVSRATKNLYIKDGILFVTLHSSVMRNELSMLKGELIRRLNEEAGSPVITDIVLR